MRQHKPLGHALAFLVRGALPPWVLGLPAPCAPPIMLSSDNIIAQFSAFVSYAYPTLLLLSNNNNPCRTAKLRIIKRRRASGAPAYLVYEYRLEPAVQTPVQGGSAPVQPGSEPVRSGSNRPVQFVPAGSAGGSEPVRGVVQRPVPVVVSSFFWGSTSLTGP